MALLGSSSLWQSGARASQSATQQEQPDHPLPQVFRSLAPAVAVIATVVTAQEQPDHPRPIVQGPLATTAAVITLPPVIGHVYTQQEQPDGSQGLSVISTGIVPHLGLMTAKFLVIQEQPYHPQPWAQIGVPPAAQVITVSPVNRTVNATRQDDIDWAFVAIEMSVPGPNNGPPYFLPVVTTQEAPDHPPSLSWSRIGIPPTLVTATLQPTNRYTYTVQEQPDLGWALAKSGVPLFIGVPFEGRIVATVQEQPDHAELSYVKSSVTPVIGVPFEGRIVATVQEQPDHTPQSWAKVGVQTFVVPTPVPPVSQIRTAQEVPDHSLPSTLGAPGVFGNPFIPPIFMAVYNTMLLAIPGGMSSIPGDPPS